MIPIRLDKEESVLVAGNFSGEDIKALHTNPTLLSAKVSYIRNAIVNLYVKGYTNFIFTNDGLFEMLVATVVNDFNGKGMAINTIFVNAYPGKRYNGAKQPEEFSHMSVCFSETAEDFDPVAFYEYMKHHVGCILSPSRIRHNKGFIVPDSMPFDTRISSTPN